MLSTFDVAQNEQRQLAPCAVILLELRWKTLCALSKAEGSQKAADSPSGYSRGEGQKPVSKAYKDNWNEIYAKKKKQ